ncbi:hypothetical protein AB5N19_00657 [Seiridium cardinale]
MEPSQNAASEHKDPAKLASGLERMRLQAVQNPDLAHRSFDSYPWAKDPIFQSQLATALLNQSDLSPKEVALQSRIKRYEERIGIKIDADKYKSYRTQEDRPRVEVVPQVILDQEALYEPDVNKRRYAAIFNDLSADQSSANDTDQDVPSWQRSAPKAALYVNKNHASTNGSSDKEPYPKKFEEIIAFLQTGKEIPGIIKIPDTVIDDPSISTTTGRSAPLKPWERKAASGNEALE